MQAPNTSQTEVSARHSLTLRAVSHLILFAALLAAGLWIGYRAVAAPADVGSLEITIDLAAMYWFALFIYGFVCLMLYYPLRRQTWWMLLLGHAVAVSIAVASTATIVRLGQQQASAPAGVPAESAALNGSSSATDDPSVQVLPLPPEDSNTAETPKQ
jgi:hypothetical protein